MICLTRKEINGGHYQQLRLQAFKIMLQLALKQSIGNSARYEKCCIIDQELAKEKEK